MSQQEENTDKEMKHKAKLSHTQETNRKDDNRRLPQNYARTGRDRSVSGMVCLLLFFQVFIPC